MVRSIRVGLFLLMAMFFTNAPANSSFSITSVTGVVVHSNGNVILVTLADHVTNAEGCNINNQMVIEKTHPFFKEMYSALLSAFHSETKIRGWVNGCYLWGMPILTRLDLTK